MADPVLIGTGKSTVKPRGRNARPADIQRYKDLRLEGLTQADAAARLGFSERWARNQDAKLKLRPQIEEAKYANPDAYLRPLRKDELSPIALDCLEDFGRFRFRQFGRISSPWQESAAYVVLEHLMTPYKEWGVINAPPGSGKSTLFTHDIPIWLVCRSRSIRELIGSSTQTTADTYTGRMRNAFVRTTPMQAKEEDLRLNLAKDAESTLIADYGIFRPDPGLGAPWSRRQFTVSQYGETPTDEKESTVTAFGKDAGFLGLRWNFIVWDDVFRRKDMLGIDRAAKIEAFRYWWDDEGESRLEPGGLMILQGQRLGAEDIYHYCINKRTYADDDDIELFELGEEQAPTEKKYFHVLYKAHYENICIAKQDPSTFPKGEDGNPIHPHSRKASNFNPTNPNGPWCLLDAVRLPYRELRAIEKKPLSNYRVVYQQEDADPEDVLIPAPWIDGGFLGEQEYDGCWDDDRGPNEPPAFVKKWEYTIKGTDENPYRLYIPPKGWTTVSIITADPSPTKFWSVQWWLYIQGPNQKRLMGNRYLMNVIFTPMGANDFLDYDTDTEEWEGLLVDWMEAAQKAGFPIQHLILEVNAAQKFMGQYKFFKTWLRDNNIKFRAHHTHINKLDEKMGVTTLRSQYESGRVNLPGNREGREICDPLYQQLTLYPDFLYDDCPMANWFMEFQLQHLVRRKRTGESVYNDIPSWVKDSPTYAA